MDWVQGPNAGVGSCYPECPDCKVPMTLPLLQLVYEEAVIMNIIRNRFFCISFHSFLLTLFLITLFDEKVQNRFCFIPTIYFFI